MERDKGMGGRGDRETRGEGDAFLVRIDVVEVDDVVGEGLCLERCLAGNASPLRGF